MTKELRYWRLAARSFLGTILVISVTAIILVMLFESEGLAGVPGEAWTLMGAGILGLSTALAILARALSKNPSDVDNGGSEEEE